MTAHAPSLARRAGAAALAVATCAWLAIVVLAPFVAALPPGSVWLRASALVYVVASGLCHQLAERSFHAWGTQLPVCARCTGLYLGACLGAVLSAALDGGSRQIPVRIPLLLAIAAVPTVGTVALEWLGLALPGNVARSVAGVPLGVAGAWIAGGVIKGELR